MHFGSGSPTSRDLSGGQLSSGIDCRPESTVLESLLPIHLDARCSSYVLHRVKRRPTIMRKTSAAVSSNPTPQPTQTEETSISQPRQNMSAPEDVFLRRLELLVKRDSCPQKRIVIALAGAPGSGKSTVAAALKKRFNGPHSQHLQIVPMVCLILLRTKPQSDHASTGWLPLHTSLSFHNASQSSSI